MLAAGGFEIFHEAHHPHPLAPKEDWGMLLLATVVAAMVSFIAVKWLLHYVQSHTFNAFGWYRIALAIAIFLFLVR
jgi:undecaprenyl-diphosphatase